MIWRCGSFELDFAHRPLIMGIVNATPDSFSDGFPECDVACEHALRLVSEGADIIDIGGESTRPGSEAVSVAQELARVIPVIEALAKRIDVPISVDTRRSDVARRAVQAGACIINHVSACLQPETMIPLLRETRVGYVAMHMKAMPKVMQARAQYRDVVAEVSTAFRTVRVALADAGIAMDRVLFDPGIGFGKTLSHNLELLRSLHRLSSENDTPLLVGLSRKSWLGDLLGVPVEDRDALTATACALLPHPVVAVHRVHDVAMTHKALRLTAALTD